VGFSTNFRTAVLGFIDLGNSVKLACQTFSISRSSIQRWRNKQTNTGILDSTPRKKTPYKFDIEALKNYLNEHPDAHLSEIAPRFNMTISGMSRALSRLNITRKKKPRNTKKEMK